MSVSVMFLFPQAGGDQAAEIFSAACSFGSISGIDPPTTNLPLTIFYVELLRRKYRLVDWNVRFGPAADICGAKRRVRFTPDSDRKCGHQIL
jgi:hypothetical protein